MKYQLRLGKALTILIAAILVFASATSSVHAAKSVASSSLSSLQATLYRPIEYTTIASSQPDDLQLADSFFFEASNAGSDLAVYNSSSGRKMEITLGFVRAAASVNVLVQTTRSDRRNANLSALTLSPWATLDPAFDSNKTEYTVLIPFDETYLEIIPQQADIAAHYSITVDRKESSSIVYLRMGQHKTARVTVSAQNGIIKKTYTLHVSRQMPTSTAQISSMNLTPIATMSFKELIADDKTRERPPAPITLPAPDTYLLEVDTVNQYITVYIKDQDGQHTIPYRLMICSTGKRSTPTPTGTFKMGGYKKRFGYFTKFDCYAQYWTNLVGGIYFHSIIYKSRSDRQLSTSTYRKLGTAVSHGCIRLLPPDAKWIYENCAPGTTVVVTRSKAADPFLRDLLQPPPIP